MKAKCSAVCKNKKPCSKDVVYGIYCEVHKLMNNGVIQSEKSTIIRPDCCCGDTRKPRVCIHYNFMTHGNGPDEFDYESNVGIDPLKLAPCAGKECNFKCSNDWCKMVYKQSPHTRSKGRRCPYCSGKSACEWNCLLTKCPDICLDIDPSCGIDPKLVTPGSRTICSWICHVCKFKWSSTVRSRCSDGSGCSNCNYVGHDQMYGGKAKFIEDARAQHGDKYSYPGDYTGIHDKIEIHCPVINEETDEPHGSFFQDPGNHKRGHGCPICAEEQIKSKAVMQLDKVLAVMNYNTPDKSQSERMFPGLIKTKALKIDRYLFPPSLGIEIDGIQHFKVVESWGGTSRFIESMIRDIIKDIYFINNGLNLLRLPYNIEATPEIIQWAISLCDSNKSKSIYISYKHYYDEVIKYCDMTNVIYIEMKSPIDVVNF